MATSRLSKEAEIKITDALSEVSELVNSGIQPNEAIAKTASDNGIPVGHIELMVRAFNVGRSEAQRHSGAEPHEKLAEFELADLKSVMDIMYPSSVKSASVLAKNASVSDAYNRPPSKAKPELPPLTLPTQMIKSAGAKVEKTEMAKDTLGSIRALSSLIEKIGADADRLRVDSSNTRDKVMQGVSKLAGYFRTYGSKPFMVVKDNSERLFGKKASALLNIILSSNRQLKKQAGTVDDVMSPVNLDEEPYKSIKQCMDLADLHINKKASHEYLNKMAKSVLASGFKNSIPSENTGSVLDGMNKKADFLPGDKPELKDVVFQGPIPGKAFKSYESNLNDDAKDYKFMADQRLQDMTLKNIRATAALSDLMSNDEIISSHHPEDVAFHFNEIGKVMPESVSNVAIMRPLLRQRLVGGMNAIAPADIQTMMEMEQYQKPNEKFSSINKIAGPYGSGMIDPFKLREEEHKRRQMAEDRINFRSQAERARREELRQKQLDAQNAEQNRIRNQMAAEDQARRMAQDQYKVEQDSIRNQMAADDQARNIAQHEHRVKQDSLRNELDRERYGLDVRKTEENEIRNRLQNDLQERRFGLDQEEGARRQESHNRAMAEKDRIERERQKRIDDEEAARLKRIKDEEDRVRKMEEDRQKRIADFEALFKNP